MWQLENTPGRTCRIGGSPYLFFSGYSYLGMSHVPEFRKHVKKGIDQYGTLFPSSRISNTRLGLYDELEEQLSLLTGMEDTVSFSSGYLAGKTIADILSSFPKTLIAPSAHPAITAGKQPVPADITYSEWQQQVTTAINSSAEESFVIISDAVNIMQGTIQDLSFLENIKREKKITCLVDDSHGIGIIGDNGKGISALLRPLSNVEYIITYSLSKAFNISGGAVSCSRKFGELLRRSPGYTGSTAISPAYAAAFIKSRDLYAIQRDRLIENITYLQSRSSNTQFHKNEAGLPIFICRQEEAEMQYHRNNIIISSFGYPLPGDKKVNRVIINSLHTKRDLNKLLRDV